MDIEAFYPSSLNYRENNFFTSNLINRFCLHLKCGAGGCVSHTHMNKNMTLWKTVWQSLTELNSLAFLGIDPVELKAISA